MKFLYLSIDYISNNYVDFLKMANIAYNDFYKTDLENLEIFLKNNKAYFLKEKKIESLRRKQKTDLIKVGGIVIGIPIIFFIFLNAIISLYLMFGLPFIISQEYKNDNSWYGLLFRMANQNQTLIEKKSDKICLVNKFIIPENLDIDNDRVTTYTFKYDFKDNEIKNYSKTTQEQINLKINFAFITVHDNEGKDSIGIEYIYIIDNYEIHLTKEYYMGDKVIKYRTYYYLDNKWINDKEVPENLKKIDFKEKLDEIDKLLEERWRLTCGK